MITPTRTARKLYRARNGQYSDRLLKDVDIDYAIEKSLDDNDLMSALQTLILINKHHGSMS